MSVLSPTCFQNGRRPALTGEPASTPLSPPADGSPAEIDSIRDLAALRQFFNVPLQLASAYRLVQGILSDPEFVRGDIDETRLTTACLTLDAVWNTLTTSGSSKLLRAEGSEYSRIWKLFVFECCKSWPSQISFVAVHDPTPPENHLDIAFNQRMAIQSERFAQLFRTCNTTHSKCRELLGTIIGGLKVLNRTSLGKHDASGLSKPIYSIAAFIARSPNIGTKEDFLVCLKALQQARWVYSDHEKRLRTFDSCGTCQGTNRQVNPQSSSSLHPRRIILKLFCRAPLLPPLPSAPSSDHRPRSLREAEDQAEARFASRRDMTLQMMMYPVARKSPTKLARVLAILEKENSEDRRK